MAQFMVANGITAEDIFEKGETISFPESVQQFFMGEIGQPTGGFPAELQRIVLKGKQPFTDRPNKHLPPVDMDREFAAFKEQFGQDMELTDFLSYKFYPKVFEEYLQFFREYGDVSVVPTLVFFYGLKQRQDITVEIAPGKTLLIRLSGIGPVNEAGNRTVFFKLNGQARAIEIRDRSVKTEQKENRKADKSNERHMAVPLQGMLSKVLVAKGEKVKKNQPLFVIEAMKMESTIVAPQAAVVKAIVLQEGVFVEQDDVVVEIA